MELLQQHPDLDIQHLRTLIRNARKEQAENKPPKAYREIFQILKELQTGTAKDEDAEALYTRALAEMERTVPPAHRAREAHAADMNGRPLPNGAWRCEWAGPSSRSSGRLSGT